VWCFLELTAVLQALRWSRLVRLVGALTRLARQGANVALVTMLTLDTASLP
jgi:hypothetical protein